MALALGFWQIFDPCMDPTPFSSESFTFSEKRLIYRGLLSLVKSNSGYGFCNNDQGHLAYAAGRGGCYDPNHDYETWGDSPVHNTLFKMMHSLSVEISAGEIDRSSEVSEYVFSWADFCRLAYGAYERAQK